MATSTTAGAATSTWSIPVADLQTISDTPTAWLPLSTAFTSKPECSTQLFAQSNGQAVLYDPYYGLVVDPDSGECLPPDVTAWWNQDTKTRVMLGPTFVCPSAYSAVQTVSMDSVFRQTLCCPKNYDLYLPMTDYPNGSLPLQCTSMISSGQTITYKTTGSASSWGWYTDTATAPTTIFGAHVNGYNLDISSSIFSTVSIPTSTITPTPSASPTISTTSSQSGIKLSTGSAAAIGVGTFAFLSICFYGAFYLWRHISQKRRQKADSEKLPPELKPVGPPPKPPLSSDKSGGVGGEGAATSWPLNQEAQTAQTNLPAFIFPTQPPSRPLPPTPIPASARTSSLYRSSSIYPPSHSDLEAVPFEFALHPQTPANWPLAPSAPATASETPIAPQLPPLPILPLQSLDEAPVDPPPYVSVPPLLRSQSRGTHIFELDGTERFLGSRPPDLRSMGGWSDYFRD